MCKHVADQGEVDTSKHNDVDFVERSAAAMDPHQPAEEALGFTGGATSCRRNVTDNTG